jgi:hypothetical protein
MHSTRYIRTGGMERIIMTAMGIKNPALVLVRHVNLRQRYRQRVAYRCIQSAAGLRWSIMVSWYTTIRIPTPAKNARSMIYSARWLLACVTETSQTARRTPILLLEDSLEETADVDFAIVLEHALLARGRARRARELAADNSSLLRVLIRVLRFMCGQLRHRRGRHGGRE